MTAASLPSDRAPGSRRNVAIAAGVVALHVGALYALQSGLLRRAVEIIVPVAIVTELITPPSPRPEPPPPQVKPPQPVPQPEPRLLAKRTPPPAPQPVAVPNLPPAPNAPTGAVEPQPAPPPIAAPVAVAPAPPAPPPPPAKVELPSSSAQHLQNPKPPYPPMSRRLGEQGTAILRVLIGSDGNVQDIQLKRSSGYDRLDASALETVRRWRFVPGKRGGVPEAMWHEQPVIFELN
jgi:protein TonB